MTTSYKFISRSSPQSISSPVKSEKFPSSFQTLKKKLSYKYYSGSPRKNFTVVCEFSVNGTNFEIDIDEEAGYISTMEQFLSNGIHSCVLYLRIGLEIAYSETNDYHPLQYDDISVSFNTKTGLDEKFRDDLNKRVAKCATTKNTMEIDFERLLINEEGTFFELSEENIHIKKLFTIMLRQSIPYSHILLKDLQSSFQCHGYTSLSKLLTAISGGGAPTSSALMDKVLDETCMIPQLEEKIHVVSKFLEYFTKLVDGDNFYSEADRRMIINTFLIPAVCPDEGESLSLSAEYNMDLSGTCRLGNGPLDYFIQSSNIDVIMTFVRDEKEEICGTTSSSVEVNFNFEPKLNISDTKICLDKSVEKSLGQLFAQMLDALKLSARDFPGQKRGYFVTVGNSGIQMVKGILSTGQHNMFFSMLKTAVQASPVLTYYGKWSVNILPKDGLRDSRLAATENVNMNEIKSLFKAFYYFIRL